MIGARCKYSAAGRGQFRRSKLLYREGTIVGEGHDKTCWRVNWDGNRPQCIDAIHKRFIEVVPGPATP